VSGDPANVGGAPIDIARMIVEDVFESGRRIDQVARSGMENAFRFAGGTATAGKIQISESQN